MASDKGQFNQLDTNDVTAGNDDPSANSFGDAVFPAGASTSSNKYWAPSSGWRMSSSGGSAAGSNTGGSNSAIAGGTGERLRPKMIIPTPKPLVLPSMRSGPSMLGGGSSSTSSGGSGEDAPKAWGAKPLPAATDNAIPAAASTAAPTAASLFRSKTSSTALPIYDHKGNKINRAPAGPLDIAEFPPLGSAKGSSSAATPSVSIPKGQRTAARDNAATSSLTRSDSKASPSAAPWSTIASYAKAIAEGEVNPISSASLYGSSAIGNTVSQLTIGSISEHAWVDDDGVMDYNQEPIFDDHLDMSTLQQQLDGGSLADGVSPLISTSLPASESLPAASLAGVNNTITAAATTATPTATTIPTADMAEKQPTSPTKTASPVKAATIPPPAQTAATADTSRSSSEKPKRPTLQPDFLASAIDFTLGMNPETSTDGGTQAPASSTSHHTRSRYYIAEYDDPEVAGTARFLPSSPSSASSLSYSHHSSASPAADSAGNFYSSSSTNFVRRSNAAPFHHGADEEQSSRWQRQPSAERPYHSHSVERPSQQQQHAERPPHHTNVERSSASQQSALWQKPASTETRPLSWRATAAPVVADQSPNRDPPSAPAVEHGETSPVTIMRRPPSGEAAKEVKTEQALETAPEEQTTEKAVEKVDATVATAVVPPLASPLTASPAVAAPAQLKRSEYVVVRLSHEAAPVRVMHHIGMTEKTGSASEGTDTPDSSTSREPTANPSAGPRHEPTNTHTATARPNNYSVFTRPAENSIDLAAEKARNTGNAASTVATPASTIKYTPLADAAKARDNNKASATADVSADSDSSARQVSDSPAVEGASAPTAAKPKPRHAVALPKSRYARDGDEFRPELRAISMSYSTDKSSSDGKGSNAEMRKGRQQQDVVPPSHSQQTGEYEKDNRKVAGEGSSLASAQKTLVASDKPTAAAGGVLPHRLVFTSGKQAASLDTANKTAALGTGERPKEPEGPLGNNNGDRNSTARNEDYPKTWSLDAPSSAQQEPAAAESDLPQNGRSSSRGTGGWRERDSSSNAGGGYRGRNSYHTADHHPDRRSGEYSSDQGPAQRGSHRGGIERSRDDRSRRNSNERQSLTGH